MICYFFLKYFLAVKTKLFDNLLVVVLKSHISEAVLFRTAVEISGEPI